MKMLTLRLEHCYGIKKLDAALDFTNTRAIVIYAPNGSMKSSLAQTFQDIANGLASQDRIFPDRTTLRVVCDEHNAELPQEDVLVVRPYEESVEHTEKTSTLLVNAALRKEYEDLHADIDAAKSALLKGVKEQSGSKRDFEKELSQAFAAREDKFYVALNRIKDEIGGVPDEELKDLPYDLIFDEKVQAFLGTKDFKTAIDAYIKKYNELLAASTYFKKGVFNYYNAAQVAKQLADNGFFQAQHSVTLNADEKKVITTLKELEDLIASEKEAITNDKELRKKFAEIEKLIQKNATVRDFESFLMDHEDLLARFANMEEFRQEILKAYINVKADLYRNLLEKYQAAEARRKEIQEQAARERTQWEEVIEIFNIRFVVPFKLVAANRVDVILGQQAMLSLGFVFNDGASEVNVDRSTLLQVLSTGEKKALYILNILFEIEIRKKTGQNTLIVVDDIADSFDYKNKYAIIQYLMDISESPFFRQLILTHNFDFFRTVESRFVGYSNCLMASKSDNGVVLERAAGIKNVFIKDWKAAFYKDARKKIASICFLRNLIEYTRGEADQHFEKLTSLLHWKEDSSEITVSDLDDIYNGLFATTGRSPRPDVCLVDLIHEQAEECQSAPEGVNFANKVVLAIATRLAAERFMVDRINDGEFVKQIAKNQTSRLLKKYGEMFPDDEASLGVLQRVALMTPENIHLNSFMYEPILDMSDVHLRTIYAEVKALMNSVGGQP